MTHDLEKSLSNNIDQDLAINRNAKVFGIGLSRTGTTSLGKALNIIGIKTKDFPSARYVPHALLWLKSEELENHQGFTDISVIPFYKKLDKQYPGSKFIYTVRNEEDWLKSCQDYPRYNFPIGKVPFKIMKLRQIIYRTIKYDRQKFINARNRHHEDVMNYFKGRESDILIMDITKGDGWGKLCPFLGLEMQDIDFPLYNASKNKHNGVGSYQK